MAWHHGTAGRPHLPFWSISPHADNAGNHLWLLKSLLCSPSLTVMHSSIHRFFKGRRTLPHCPGWRCADGTAISC